MRDAISRVLAEIRENLGTVAEERPVDHVETRRMAQRIERLTPWRGYVAEEDYARILRDRLDTKAHRVVAAFIAARDSNPQARFLWLAGSRGTGKTVAALWGLVEVGGRYATAEDVRRAYSQEHDEARALRPRLTECALLIVDDIGTARDEHSEERALFELLNSRQGGQRQTILTGNLSRAAVSQRFGGRVLDRVFHSGRVIDCGTVSLRRGAS